MLFGFIDCLEKDAWKLHLFRFFYYFLHIWCPQITSLVFLRLVVFVRLEVNRLEVYVWIRNFTWEKPSVPVTRQISTFYWDGLVRIFLINFDSKLRKTARFVLRTQLWKAKPCLWHRTDLLISNQSRQALCFLKFLHLHNCLFSLFDSWWLPRLVPILKLFYHLIRGWHQPKHTLFGFCFWRIYFFRFCRDFLLYISFVGFFW